MKTLLIFTALTAVLASPAAFAKHSSHIDGFEYTSCSEHSCILVTAPRAWMGLTQDYFTTEGKTELKLTDANGKELSAFSGESASLNPKMRTILLESGQRGFLLYSLETGKLSDFRTGAAK